MPKQRTDKWIRKGFSLSEEAVDKLKEGANYYNLNESNYIEFLITRQSESLDPLLRLQSISKRINELRAELKKEEENQIKIAEELTKYQEWIKEKRSKHPQAVKILARKILNKEYQEAEKVAKTWAVMLGISPVQLLTEAQEEINKGI